MKIVRCFLDTETTGTDPSRHGITQIAGVIEAGSVTREFNLRCRPFEGDVIEDAALEVQRKTREEIMAYPDPLEVHTELRLIFHGFVNPMDRQDKMFLIGYNVRFDDEMLRAWFRKNGDPYYGSWFWFPYIDVMTLAGQHLMENRCVMANFKQNTVARALGIEYEESDLHDALNDIKVCRGIYRKLTGGQE